MGYLYAIQSGIFGPNLHNVLSAVAVISIGLIVLWVVFLKNSHLNQKNRIMIKIDVV